MKYLSFIISIAIVTASCNANNKNELKRYDVKSGIVEYETIISGKMMGSKVSGEGIEKLYFKSFGAIELREAESSQTTTTKIFGHGQTDTESTHTINKLDNGDSYFVDFEKRQIYMGQDLAMEMTKALYPNADAGEMGESMLESMGGQKTGSEKFLGYSCDIWEFAGGKQWIYKGVMLKLEITMLGITTVTQAIKADFDVQVPDKYFNLPDFPVQKEESMAEADDNMDGIR